MGVKASKLTRVVSFRSFKRLRGPPMTTPRGYIPVAVGVDQEIQRFMVHTTALSNSEFVQLLRRSAEEYGFRNKGILRIPYDARAFQEWMNTNGKHKIWRVKPMMTTD